MKNIFIIFLFLSLYSFSQENTYIKSYGSETEQIKLKKGESFLYYIRDWNGISNDWKGISNIAEHTNLPLSSYEKSSFSSIYRVLKYDKKNRPVGEIRDYWVDSIDVEGNAYGVLYRFIEGASHIDKEDDSKSILNGSVLTFKFWGTTKVSYDEDGKLEGEWLEYYGNKVKPVELRSLSYQKEKKGQFSILFNYGQPQLIAQYLDDKLIGEVKEYYKSGEIQRILNFNPSESIPDEGKAINYYKSGNISSEQIYKNDTIVYEICFDEDGLEMECVEKDEFGFELEVEDNDILYGESQTNPPTLISVPNSSLSKKFNGINLKFNYDSCGQLYETVFYKDNGKIKNVLTNDENDGITSLIDSSIDNTIYTEVDEKPEPMEGIENFYKNLVNRLFYPLKARRYGVEGQVFVQFIVDKEGYLNDVQVIGNSPGYGLNYHACYAVSLSKKWNPGKINGEKVMTRMILPISFTLSN